MVPAIALDQIDDLARQRSAGDQQNLAPAGGEGELVGGFDIDQGHGPSIWRAQMGFATSKFAGDAIL